MRWSIRYQLLVPLLLLLLGIVSGISTWTAFASVRHTRQEIETRMRQVARILDEGRFPLKDNILEMTKGLSGAEYLLVGANGVHTTTLTGGVGELPALENIAEDSQSLRLGPEVAVAGKRYLGSGVRLRHGPDAGSTLYILYPESLWRNAFWEAILPSLVLGALGGLASVALAAGLAQRLSRRIQELERRTRLIASGDFSPMPLPGRDDELRDLGRSVNDMAQQLAQLQDAVKKTERLRLLGQVSGGLAHQLRNGVTGARLAVQLHARDCNGQADPEALEVALRQLALVEENLKRFLDLGRTEEMQRQPCALKALLDEVVRLLQPQCRHAHIDLRWQPSADPTVAGDAGQLRHLFLNVLGNAVEAAGPNGWVEVRLEDNGALTTAPAGDTPVRAQALIEVLDSGPGPASEVADRLFEPFVTGKREGVGLGLAVARRVAEAHGGSISWKRAADQTCFRIELPLETMLVKENRATSW